MVLFLIFFLIFKQQDDKILKNGNTSNSGSIDEIESNLCQISYYQATIEVTVQSNKNTNTYTLKQEYEKQGEQEIAKQEVLLPENLKGVQIIKKQNQLEVKNTTLNLSKIYEKYQDMTKNDLWLDDFLEEYQESVSKQRSEEENVVIFQIDPNTSPYQKQKKLYVSKETGKPQKLVVEDMNQKNKVYILYKEIEMRSVKEK